MNKKTIKEEIYNEEFILVWGCTVIEFANYVWKKHKFDIEVLRGHKYLGKTVFVYNEEDTTEIYVWIDSKKNIPTLTHELLHLTCKVMKRAGITLTEESEEAFAYYQTFLVKESLKALKK